jgi:hypothetical protein
MRSALASSTQYLRDDVIGDYCNFIVELPHETDHIINLIKQLLTDPIQSTNFIV